MLDERFGQTVYYKADNAAELANHTHPLNVSTNVLLT